MANKRTEISSQKFKTTSKNDGLMTTKQPANMVNRLNKLIEVEDSQHTLLQNVTRVLWKDVCIQI